MENVNYPSWKKVKAMKLLKRRRMGESEKAYMTDFRLSFCEKIGIIIFFIFHRVIQLLLAVQIMMSYDLMMLIVVCFSISFGNFLFSGMMQDQIIISRIKRQLKL